jgi:hypothetical protein
MVTRVRADRRGFLTVKFRVPAKAQPPYYVVLTDSEGNYASFDGLSRPRGRAEVEGGRRPRPPG